MSLTSSLEVARSSLSVLSERTSVISRNVANAGNDQANRKIAHTATAPGGLGVRLIAITRASNDALFENFISANSAAGQQKAIVDALDQLNRTVSDTEQDASPAALAGKLADAIQQFATAPQDSIRAATAFNAASDLARNLNDATTLVQRTRAQADVEIADAVVNLNELLARFENVNRDVIIGTRLGNDVTDLLDTRDNLLTDISREIGIRTITREHNDVLIFTDSGVVLFEKQARSVGFDPTSVFDPSVSGNPLLVDGVRVTGDTSPLPVGSGRIKGLTDIRDEIAVTYQSQLDEIARGLIAAFSESDQSAIPALPDATGLFTYSGSPAVPPSGTLIAGLAGQIAVNAAADPSLGGNPFLIRDGGFNGAAYIYNGAGAAGYAARLRELQDRFYAPIPFDAAAEAGISTTLVDFASNSVGWLQEIRQRAASQFEFRTTVYERSLDSLTKLNGVNLDYEMTLLLELERSYQATSRLISTIDAMYESLLAAVR